MKGWRTRRSASARLPIDASLLGTPQRVRGISSSPRSSVWLADFPGIRAVVKQTIGEPDAAERFERECTALRLAGRADPGVAPQVLAIDPERRVVVLERLPIQRRTMPGWVAYAEGLARLHGVTSDDDVGALPAADTPTSSDVAAFSRFCASFDLEAPVDELASLPSRLAGGQDLVHGDPCAGNVVVVDGRARFIDFEHAALGNGLSELAYLRIGFPTCWNLNTVPARSIADAEAAYRALHPEANGSIAEHCVGWTIRSDALVERAHRDGTDHFERLLERDWTWGFVGARQRLAYRLHVVANLDAQEVTATSKLARALRLRMIAEWPGCDRPPAKAARSSS